MFEGSDNLGASDRYNVIGFSCVTLWNIIKLMNMILDMYQAVCGVYHYQKNPAFGFFGFFCLSY